MMQVLIKQALAILDLRYRMAGAVKIQEKNKFTNSALGEKQKGILQGIYVKILIRNYQTIKGEHGHEEYLQEEKALWGAYFARET